MPDHTRAPLFFENRYTVGRAVTLALAGFIALMIFLRQSRLMHGKIEAGAH